MIDNLILEAQSRKAQRVQAMPTGPESATPGTAPVPVAKPAGKYPTEPNKETVNILTMMVGPVLTLERWQPEISEKEREMLITSWALCLDYYFPDGIAMHPAFGAATATVFVLGPRSKFAPALAKAGIQAPGQVREPPKKTEKKPEKKSEKSTVKKHNPDDKYKP